ncbi:MAG: ATP-binding protein [Planctomycetota bacterium]|jgi:hypothetical protein
MNWASILVDDGFEELARVARLGLVAWWHPQEAMEVQVIDLGERVLLRGCRSYYAIGISEEGELRARDIEPMVEWLEETFPTLRIHFTYHRDITRALAISAVSAARHGRTGNRDGKADPDDLQGDLGALQASITEDRERIQNLRTMRRAGALLGGGSPLWADALKQEERRLRRELDGLVKQSKALREKCGLAGQLVSKWERDSAAVSLEFLIATEGHWAASRGEFKASVRAIAQELADTDRLRIRQKLNHGRYHITVCRSESPEASWLGLWSGGLPGPRELERWGESLAGFRRDVESRFIITPGKDIRVGGAVKAHKKLVAPRVIRSFLKRLPRKKHSAPPPAVHTTGEFVGLLMSGDEITGTPFYHPPDLKNGYVSGTTRAGKSYTARVAVENAIIAGARVVVLDRTKQWPGLTRPASDTGVLERMDEFGLGRGAATGFDVRIFRPDLGEEIPDDPDVLFAGSSVLCLKGLDDRDSCRVALDLFSCISKLDRKEGASPAILLVVEEAHGFLAGNVHKDADGLAKELMRNLSSIARTQVKYNISLLFISQSLADFAHGGRIVREMTNTRFFMRATDRAELDFVERYVSREAAETVKELRPGQALVHGSMTPTAKVLIRPPLSETRELSDEELVSSGRSSVPNAAGRGHHLSERESAAMAFVVQRYRDSGNPVAASELGQELGIRGGSRQRLIDRLLAEGLVRTVDIRGGRGRPRQGIVPVDGFAP